MKFPSDNFSACWSTRWRGKRLPASWKNLLFQEEKKITPYPVGARV
jgi:hypothetical protein